jgi:hypothetical protein
MSLNRTAVIWTWGKLMGEHNWYARYRDARDYADEQAAGYARGELIEGWRQVSETDPRRET